MTGEVDRHARTPADTLQLGKLHDRVANDPQVDLRHQVKALGGRQEGVRLNDVRITIGEPHQRFAKQHTIFQRLPARLCGKASPGSAVTSSPRNGTIGW